MINFFRKLRKKGGTRGKYLKYAIGEIALVVIGILIALSINNWNEQRKQNKKEEAILLEVLSDLDENVRLLEEALGDTGNIRRNLNSMYGISQHLEKQLPWQDTLAIHFQRIFTYRNVNYKTSGSSSLLSFGTDLIRKDSLRQQIGLYYNNDVPQTRQQLIEVRDDFYNYMLGYMRNDFLSGTEAGKEVLYPVDYRQLLQKTDFQQSLKIYASMTKRYIRQVEKSIRETESLRISIHNYLTKVG